MDIKLGKPQILEVPKGEETAGKASDAITVEFGFKVKIPKATAIAVAEKVPQILDRVPAIMREVPGVVQQSTPALVKGVSEVAPHLARAGSEFFNSTSPEIQQVLAKGINEFGALVGRATAATASAMVSAGKDAVAGAVDTALAPARLAKKVVTAPFSLAASAARFGAGVLLNRD